MCYLEWSSEPFLVRDQVEFEDWLTTYWPEATFFRDNRGAYTLGPNWDWLERHTYSELYGLPTTRYDPARDDHDGYDEHVFLEELSYRIYPAEACIIEVVDRCGCSADTAWAIAIRGGDEEPDFRIGYVSLAEAGYQKATDLAGGRLLLAAE